MTVLCSAAFAFETAEMPERVFKGKYVTAAQEVKNKNCILVDVRGTTLGTIKGAVVLDWKQLATYADGKGKRGS